MVKKTRVWPNIIISTTEGSAITAARPTRRPKPGQPMVSSTCTSASLEQTSGWAAPAPIRAQRPVNSAEPGDSAVVHVSAATGAGLDALLGQLDALLEHDPLSRVHLRIPQKEGKALALIEAGGRVLSRDYQDGQVEMEAEAPASVLRKLRAFVIE